MYCNINFLLKKFFLHTRDLKDVCLLKKMDGYDVGVKSLCKVREIAPRMQIEAFFS